MNNRERRGRLNRVHAFHLPLPSRSLLSSPSLLFLAPRSCRSAIPLYERVSYSSLTSSSGACHPCASFASLPCWSRSPALPPHKAKPAPCARAPRRKAPTIPSTPRATSNRPKASPSSLRRRGRRTGPGERPAQRANTCFTPTPKSRRSNSSASGTTTSAAGRSILARIGRAR